MVCVHICVCVCINATFHFCYHILHPPSHVHISVCHLFHCARPNAFWYCLKVNTYQKQSAWWGLARAVRPLREGLDV